MMNMNLKHSLLTVTFGAALTFGSIFGAQAFFNSLLVINRNYRSINFGMGYEMYVDLNSLVTIKDN